MNNSPCNDASLAFPSNLQGNRPSPAFSTQDFTLGLGNQALSLAELLLLPIAPQTATNIPLFPATRPRIETVADVGALLDRALGRLGGEREEEDVDDVLGQALAALAAMEED